MANTSADLAFKSTATVEKIICALEVAPVKHLDETGLRIDGKTNWLHVVSNQTNSWYRVNRYKHRYNGLIPPSVQQRLREIYTSIVERGLEYHQSLPPLARKSN